MLHERGDIELTPVTKQILLDNLLPAVRRLVDNDYRIIDVTGEPSEFGDLSPFIPFVGIPVNSFNMLVSLHLLRSAGTYDAEIMAEYEDRIAEWAPTIALTMEVLGEFLKDIGHYSVGKPSYSDMAAIGLAAYSLLSLEDRRQYTKYINRGLTGLWEVVKYERNAAYTIPYAAMVRNGPKELARVFEIIEDWRDFPVNKQFHIGEKKEESDFTHPLANRPISSHYPKSDPNRTVVGPQKFIDHSYYSAQDYLLIYYMARYHGLFPKN